MLMNKEKKVAVTDYRNMAQELGININKLPEHIAFIMDGNRRWANAQEKEIFSGHKAGIKVVKELVRSSLKLQIPVLTIFAFSTENWQRESFEVNFLMSLFEEFIKKECLDLKNNGIKLKFIGKTSELNHSLQNIISWAEKETSLNNSMTVNVAINYGGRKEIVEAAMKIIEDIENNKLSKKEINEQVFENYLYTKGLPEPELIIRTSGESRISNFLLWQMAYSEIWITKTLWPDFTVQEFFEAIFDFQKRQRRFGKL